MFKNLRLKLGLCAVLAFILLNSAYAQNIVTSSGVWFRSGGALLTNPSGLDIGSSSSPIGDLYGGTLNVSGFTASGDLDMDSNDILNVNDIDINGKIDQDYVPGSVAPNNDAMIASLYDVDFNANSTTNSPVGFSFQLRKVDNNDLTGSGKMYGGLFASTNSGTGTMDYLIGMNSLARNFSTGTVTKAAAFQVQLANVNAGGTFTDGVGIEFDDVGAAFYPVNTYAFNFEGDTYVSNGRAVSVADDLVQMYMPISSADTGITFDSNDLTLSTTTSGKVFLDGIDGNYVPDGGLFVVGNDSAITLGNQHTLQVLGTGAIDGGAIIGRFSNDNGESRLDFVKGRSATIGGTTIVQDNDRIGSSRFYGADGNDLSTLIAANHVEVDDSSPAQDDIGSAFVWSQMPGGGGVIRETVRIESDSSFILSNGGNDKGQTTSFKKNTETLTFAGNPGDASKTTSSLIPDGSILLGITTRVTNTATNCISVKIGDGTDDDMFGATTGITQNTTTDNSDATAQFGMSPATSAKNVTITANGGNCFDGSWDVTAHYIEVGASTSN